ncbi:MAG: hypothetical protein U0930_00055 [Pirellulales bacterium]
MLVGYFMVAMVCGGATCARKRTGLPEFNPPPVFTEGTPSLDQVMAQTNRSLAIKSLSSNSLTIKSPELAYPLSGHFRWERPDKLRLETKLVTSALGVPLAAGSNSDLFWLQTSRPTPTIFYARHNEFENQLGGRHVLPVSPLWLREAFGIIELDPQMVHEGPTTMPDGKLEVVTQIPTARGNYKRTIIMAPTTGTIEETRLNDPNGKLVAQARLLQHQFYSGINWSLPHQVQISLLPDVGEPITFSLDVGYYQYNEAMSPKSFVFPDTTGLTSVDLVRLNGKLQQETNLSEYSQQAQAYTQAGQQQGSAAGTQNPAQAYGSVTQPYGSPNVGAGTMTGGSLTGGSLQWTTSPHANVPSLDYNQPQLGSPVSGPASNPDSTLDGTPGAITPPVYRTNSASLQNWQGNLRR